VAETCYWHAHAEKNGKRIAGSDVDAIEASSPDSAARRATRYYWIERRQLFDHSDAKVREILVVIARHLPVDPSRDSTTPTLGPPTRWKCQVSVTQQESSFELEPAFDRTQMVSIQVEQLTA
jgi:hypothetical protein